MKPNNAIHLFPFPAHDPPGREYQRINAVSMVLNSDAFGPRQCVSSTLPDQRFLRPLGAGGARVASMAASASGAITR